MSTHTKRMSIEHLVNDLCRSYREEEEATRLVYARAMAQKKKYLAAYYFKDLH